MTEQSTAAPSNGSANPAAGPNPNPASDWRANLIGEIAGDSEQAAILETLKPFEKPTDFLKTWQETSTELKTLKEKPSTFDWRKELAGGDEKAIKTFERFATPKDAGKAYLEAVTKIRSNETAKPLPADATPEQAAEWRKANGIPDKPEGYFEKLPNGRVIGQEDQPLFNEFANSVAHKHNLKPEAVSDIVEWYYKLADTESAQLSEVDKTHTKAAEDALRSAWGDDYRANTNHLENYMAGLPEPLQKAFRDGFGGDGRKLMHNPEFVQWFSNIAREFNPVGIVTAGGNESQMSTISDELNQLVKLSGNQHSEYWKGPKAAQMQARHIQLIEAQDKLKSRMR